MLRVGLSSVPEHSALRPLIEGASFHDAYRFPISNPDSTALEIFLGSLARSPAWIETLMWLRNKTVRMAGLKDLGGLGAIDPAKPAASYRPGDRIGIFTLQKSRETEVIVGDTDKHLDVWLSLCKLPPDGEGHANGHWATLTTLVRTKNAFGALYMGVVTPFHRLIAPAMLRTYVAREVASVSRDAG